MPAVSPAANAILSSGLQAHQKLSFALPMINVASSRVEGVTTSIEFAAAPCCPVLRQLNLRQR
jgi:hypothetical protein